MSQTTTFDDVAGIHNLDVQGTKIRGLKETLGLKVVTSQIHKEVGYQIWRYRAL